ncbi:DUF389 domain-containing protein [uncultured Flavobacterium sp.]|uniref:DUF389 domain-containing protein n=1 Tax=uncultured Flavobacterium sp. TaxID=165435 RepID=UPI0025FF78EB|nr:DUF389 domain-containing protein [uncultured Flavobacterium sp.]
MVNFRTLFNLSEGEDDREKTLATITKNISFKGSNLWVLACAILIACVGLNMNSPVAIIGAMLISPLMGPVVGAGFSLGIYDFTLFKRSLLNIFIAGLVSLTVSTLYFLISPFKDVQPELLAQTSPTIFDILIAFTGGIVGVIAVTRVEKGNPVAGVAIATALMPPLCTAGYGIATAHWQYFLGAFYMYCINCVFIGIATFLMIKYLKYPPKKQVNERQERQVRLIITLLIAAMLAPGGYFAYSLYSKQQFKKGADVFVDNEFISKGYTVVYKKSDFNAGNKKLELAFLQKRFSDGEIDSLRGRLSAYPYLNGTKLIIRQDTTDQYSALKGDILNEIKSSENEISLRDAKIVQLEKTLEQGKFDTRQLLKETKALFPQVTSIALSKSEMITEKDSTTALTTVIYDAPKSLSGDDAEKLRNWLNQRLAVKNVTVFRKE